MSHAGYRYIAHLYCLAVQADFDAVECWIFVRGVAGSILGLVRSEDIFLHLCWTSLKDKLLQATKLEPPMKEADLVVEQPGGGSSKGETKVL